jgi:alkanesulfonate monooxygenase SsuD/methylene tetrahydromethanopterin reductase-like flavin-dependent oxidoreductase (luciferase family)
VRVLQGISPLLAPTREAAAEKLAALESLITREQALQFLSDYFGGHDFADATLDARAVDLGLHESTDARADFRRFRALVAQQNPTLRALYSMLTGSMDLSDFIGTPQQVADSLERWVDAGAADGFILMAPSLPDGLEDFVDQVVPLLQARGRVRTAYEGRTLREHLGLQRPVHAATEGR